MTGTNAFSAADLVAFIAEYWTPLTLQEFFAKAVAAEHFVNLADFQSEGNDIYHVPNIYTNAFTVSTQSTAGAEVSLNSPTSVDVTLTVNNHVYIAYIIADMERQQIAKSFNLTKEYTSKAGGTLATDLEGDLFALWSGLSTNTVGDTATVVTDSEIRQTVNKLDSLNMPLEECAWFFHPYVYWIQVLAIQKYYDQSQFAKGGGGGGAAMTGTLNGTPIAARGGYRGSLYGMPLYTSTNVVSGLQTYRNLLAHRTAFGYAIQTPGGAVRTQSQYWLANLGVLTIHDLIDGVAELRDNAACLLNASSAFLGS